MERQLAGWAASSQDPTVVANKVKGAILALSGVIIFIAAYLFNVTVTPDDIVQLAAIVSTMAGISWSLYGAILHFVTWVATIRA